MRALIGRGRLALVLALSAALWAACATAQTEVSQRSRWTRELDRGPTNRHTRRVQSGANPLLLRSFADASRVRLQDEVLQRFDCKMALTWRPTAKRFAFVSDDVTVVTACKYETYMWHHVLVSIDGQGKGQLIVDGKAQSLLN